MPGLDLLTLFNALMPKDRGSRRIARDLAYARIPASSSISMPHAVPGPGR